MLDPRHDLDRYGDSLRPVPRTLGGELVGPGVVVLGAHRSGTSLVARMLAALGLEPGSAEELRPGDRYNPDGYFERRSLLRWHDEVLNASGGFASAPPAASALVPLTPERRRGFGAALHGLPAAGGWLVKDPRHCLLLGHWKELRGEVDLAIVVVRHPGDVVQSLRRRSGYRPALGMALWERYNRALVTGMAGRAGLVVPYEDLVARPVAWAEALAACVARRHPQVVGSTIEQAAALVEARHPAREHREVAPTPVDALHGALVELGGYHDALPAVTLGEPTPYAEALLDRRRRRLRRLSVLRRLPELCTTIDSLPGRLRRVAG